MYFSSLFPYLVLICFLVRALLLEGSMVGIRHMFTPKVSVQLHLLQKASGPAARADATLRLSWFAGAGLQMPPTPRGVVCFVLASQLRKRHLGASIFAHLRTKRCQ